MARDDKVIIRLTVDVKQDFQQLAESLGMTISGLGGYVIGKFISDHRIEAQLREKVAMQMLPDLSNLTREFAQKQLELQENRNAQKGL